MILETERFILHRWKESDAEDICMSKVWCGYYEGNAKSKHVQEKVGFKYQWTTEGVDVPLMHEKRTGHVNAMTKEEWQALL